MQAFFVELLVGLSAVINELRGSRFGSLDEAFCCQPPSPCAKPKRKLVLPLPTLDLSLLKIQSYRFLLIFCIPLFNKDNNTENNSLTSATCCPTTASHFYLVWLSVD